MKTGFTLIELLVVVLIIGILSSVALPQYTKAVEKSRMAEARTMLKSISNAHEIYLLANPNGWATFDDLDLSFTNENGSVVGSGSSFNTKNFSYLLAGGWCPDGKHHLAYAARRNSNMVYGIGYCPDIGWICEDATSGSVCKSLGMSRSASCISSHSISNASCWAE